MMDVILVLDTGSSSMRGILYDMQGNIRKTHQIQYTMTVGADSSAVMEASVFADCLKQLCALSAKTIAEAGYRLCGISLDSQRSSVLAVDADIQPIYPILMWYDKRSAGICDALSQETLAKIYNCCGMRLTPISSAPKMLWLKRNHPEIYESAYKLIGIHDYLLYQLTGKLMTDASCACRSALMDIRSFDWSQELLDIFEIQREKLVPILRPGSYAAELSEAFSRESGLPVVPVISGGGDQQCCLLGQGLTQEGMISVNSGSASYLSIPLREVTLDSHREVNLCAYFGDQPWVMEASNMGSGTLYQWFNRNFYHQGQDVKDICAINAEVAAEPAGANGLLCLADFAGKGCPSTNPNARGVFMGVGLQHTRGSFARAILEGICYDIYDCICYMRGLGVEITGIQSTGGLTNFSVFNQILADLSGLPVMVKEDAETTAKGAFLAAMKVLKREFPVQDAAAVCYQPNAENAEIYRKMGEIRKNYYHNFKS